MTLPEEVPIVPNPEVLFPEPEAQRTKPLGMTEPDVHWLTESTRAEARISRENVNRWYAEFPDDHRSTFASRLRSEDDVTHIQALDELYVHHLLARDPERELEYEEGGRGPDFRSYRHGLPEAAVEIVSLFERNDWKKEARQHGSLTDELNKRLVISTCMVHFEVVELDRTPSIRKLVTWIEKEIAELPDRAAVVARYEEGGFSDLPHAVYRESGVRLNFTFSPVPGNAPGVGNPEHRIVAGGPIVGGLVNSAERLKDRLGDKRLSRYEVTRQPYLIIVGNHDSFCSDDCVQDAVYGHQMYNFEAQHSVRSGGFFGADTEKPNGRHRGISSVVMLDRFTALDPSQAEIVAYENPYAAQEPPEDLLPVTRRVRALR